MRTNLSTASLLLLATLAAQASPPRTPAVTGNPDPLQQAAELNNQAAVLADQERYLEAESKYRAALRIIARHAGPHSPQAARPLNNLAVVYRRLGRLRDAETRYLQSLAVREQTGDPVGAARVRLNLARLYLDQQRFAEARKILDQAPSNRALQAELFHTTAALHLHAKEYVAAAESGRRARQAWIARNRPAEAAQARALQAQALRLSGRARESLPAFREALAELKAAFGPDHPEVGRTTAALGRALKASGERRRGKRLQAQGRAILAAAPDRAARNHIVDLRSGYTRSR